MNLILRLYWDREPHLVALAQAEHMEMSEIVMDALKGFVKDQKCHTIDVPKLPAKIEPRDRTIHVAFHDDENQDVIAFLKGLGDASMNSTIKQIVTRSLPRSYLEIFFDNKVQDLTIALSSRHDRDLLGLNRIPGFDLGDAMRQALNAYATDDKEFTVALPDTHILTYKKNAYLVTMHLQNGRDDPAIQLMNRSSKHIDQAVKQIFRFYLDEPYALYSLLDTDFDEIPAPQPKKRKPKPVRQSGRAQTEEPERNPAIADKEQPDEHSDKERSIKVPSEPETPKDTEPLVKEPAGNGQQDLEDYFMSVLNNL